MIMLRNFLPTAMFRTPFARIFLTFQKQIEALENDREVPSEQKTAVRMLNNEHNNANRYHTACSPEHLRVVLFFPPPLFVPQPILRWTLAVLSQHNTINNALAEGAM